MYDPYGTQTIYNPSLSTDRRKQPGLCSGSKGCG